MASFLAKQKKSNEEGGTIAFVFVVCCFRYKNCKVSRLKLWTSMISHML